MAIDLGRVGKGIATGGLSELYSGGKKLSSGGGKGGGKGEQPTGSAALENFLNEYATQTRPGREELFSQITEALKTGGVGARLPIVGKAVEASRSAASETMKGTEESLARVGLSGTPWGQNVSASTRLAGNLAVSRVPTDMTARFLEGALPALTGAPQTIAGGFGSLAATQTQQQIASDQMINDLFTALLGAGGSIGAGLAGKKA